VLDRSLIRIGAVSKSGGTFSLSLYGYAGHNYQFERSGSANVGWQNIGEPVRGNNATLNLNDASGTVAARQFYRVSVSP
jgi:hypothetical protein